MPLVDGVEITPDYLGFPQPQLPAYPEALVVWGNPYHGLVEGGVLTLTTGDTREVTTATLQSGRPGDVIAWRQPTPPPPPIQTPEQQAADAAAGMEWRDYALLYGLRRVNGKSLGGVNTWIYAAPDRSRWLISLAGSSINLTASWSATVTAKRFGEFPHVTGHPVETYSLPVSLADWQQAIPGKAGGDYSIDLIGSVTTSVGLTLEDASLSGARAVFMLARSYSAEPIARRSLGFIEISMTGVPGVDWSAGLTVARTRAQTLGIATVDETLAPVTMMGVFLVPSLATTPDFTAYPACVGWTYFTYTPNPAVLDPAANQDHGVLTRWPLAIGTQTFSHQITGRIVAMAYQGETLGEYALDIDNAGAMTFNTPTQAGSGAYVIRNAMAPDNVNMVCQLGQAEVVSDDYLCVIEQIATGTCTSTLKLTAPDGSTFTLTGVHTITRTQRSSQPYFGFYVQPYAHTATADNAWDVGGFSHSVNGNASAPAPDPSVTGTSIIPWFAVFGGAREGYLAPYDGFFADWQILDMASAQQQGGNIPARPIYRHAVVRFSNRLLELALPALNSSYTITGPWRYLGSVGGAAPGAVIDSASQRPFGSVNPISGEVARASAVPVAWV